MAYEANRCTTYAMLTEFMNSTAYTSYGGGCNAQLSSINERLADIENLLWPPAPNSINVGDIVYWDVSTKSRKTISPDRWISTLGTPIGVVTIPDGFAPDGKARMMSLSGVTSGGTISNGIASMRWSSSYIDTSLTNYNRVPTTDNAGSTSTGSNSTGYLPSDNFTGATSYVDSVAKYYSTSNFTPSPYKIVDGITYPNPEYYKEISGYNNVLSDFSGEANTKTLVGLGTGYTAANACWKYSDGVSTTQWYLPAMGELGYMMPRFNVINSTLVKLNAIPLTSYGYYWSSSEYSSNYVYTVYVVNGGVSNLNSKNSNSSYARPWAVV